MGALAASPVSRERTAVLRRQRLLRSAFPDNSPLERARRPIGELRVAVSTAQNSVEALNDWIAGLVEALVDDFDPFGRACRWDFLLEGKVVSRVGLEPTT